MSESIFENSQLQAVATSLDTVSKLPHEIIYLSTNSLELIHYCSEAQPSLEFLANMIRQKLGEKTVIFPTATLHLVGRSSPFDARKTPSRNMGAINEHLRKTSAEYRTRHPFWSVAGFGSKARELLQDHPGNAYGPRSIWDRLLDQETLSLSIGLPVRKAMPVVHHVEQSVGVPYRKIEVFEHEVVDYDGLKTNELFTINLLCEQYKVRRDGNKKLSETFSDISVLCKEPRIEICDYRALYSHLESCLINDIFSWVGNSEEVKLQCLGRGNKDPSLISGC